MFMKIVGMAAIGKIPTNNRAYKECKKQNRQKQGHLLQFH